MRSTIYSAVFLFITTSSFAASNLDSIYNDASNLAKSNLQMPFNAIRDLKPVDNYQKYTDNPKETNLYHGVTSDNAQDLAQAANTEVSKDNAGNAVENSFKVRQQYFVNPNSPEMQRGDVLLGYAANIATGTPGPGIDCKNSEICHPDYYTQNCNEVTRYVSRTCTRTPKVTIVDQPYTQAQSYAGSIPANSPNSGAFVLPVPGTITTFSVVLKASDNIWKCKVDYYGYVQGSYLSTYHGGCGDGLSDLSFSNYGLNTHVDANQSISFYFQGGPSYGYWAYANYSLNIIAELHRKVAKVDWVESCSGNLSGGICTDKEKTCTEQGGTRYFDGIPVNLDCWNYSVVQQCTAQSDNNCQPLRDKGCSQTSATCRTKLSDTCVVQDEIYSCPTKKCDAFGIVCNDGTSYCLKGDCSAHERIPDQDMAKSLSALSAAADAAKQFDSKNLAIFTGAGAKCSRDNLGFADCCVDKGWGEDIKLASCSDEEKKLGNDKEAGLTVYVGDYTVNHVVWVEHKKAYCSFGTKLAKIIQQQGRPQLGITFGDPENPVCRGLTPEELQRIDFSKIDFSEFYTDLQKKEHIVPDNQVNQRINQDVNEMYHKGKPHA